MSVREVASSEFYELSRRTTGKLLVVQFTATWCGPCRRVAPQYEALARRTPDVEFVKVYEHNSRDAIMASGVRSFPTFHFYAGGSKVDECRGANIQAVEQKALQHKASASAAGGPVMVKLRFERQKPRQSGEGFVLVAEEMELEVHPSEGLEIFKFQVLSITDIKIEEQALTGGDANRPIDTDASLTAALQGTGGGMYGNYPVVRVTKRVPGAGGQGGSEDPAQSAQAKKSIAAVDVVPAWDECCSRTFFGKRPVKQPAYVIREESLLPQADLTDLQKRKAGPESLLVVCKACGENCFVPGRAMPTSAISECLAFVCQSKEACERGFGSDLFSERADTGVEVFQPGSSAATSAEAAAGKAADQVYYAARGVSAGGVDTSEMKEMRQRISSGISVARTYEDSALQAKARASLPSEGGEGTIAQRAMEMATERGVSKEEGLALALLKWFKKDFFKWTNKPACCVCGARGASMENKGVQGPNPEEAAGKASRVEVYRCKECGAQTRFPRYVDAGKLLETRNGRCGEFANCFTLMCRAVGLEARRAMDWTDHVWTEIWIPAKNRWVHADPCENKLDKPLMYEQGWNKRLSYVIAVDSNGGVDVTRRYTRRWMQVLSRRNDVPEKWLAGVLEAGWVGKTALVSARLAEEQDELKGYESMTVSSEKLDDEEKEARQTGDAAWIASRGEGGIASASTGSGDGTPSKSVASPLIGVPLGVLQPGGGLALCVAAVGGRSGDASILVGGATVCGFSGGGRGALCAAAVSATAGILIDARTFPLYVETDCAAIVAWASDLPDGVVVAIVTGGGSNTDDSLGAGLAEEITKLVYDDRSDAEESKYSGRGNSMNFAIVGWKGADSPKWARRQDQGEASSRSVALYADLLFGPPSAPANPVPEPKQVELKDKMCLCPLRSHHGEATVREALHLGVDGGAALPVRGICYRSGEPTVSVGPMVDLVDCAGWTTVLQSPEATTMSDTKGGNASPTSAWTVAVAHPAMGGWHDDTEGFDDGAVGCPSFVMGGAALAMPDGTPPLRPARVREIVGWGGDSFNGVQVVYDVDGDTVRTPKRMGDHGFYRQSSIALDVEGGEVLTEISVKCGDIVDSLRVRTSKGREKKWGGDGGSVEKTWRIPEGSSFLGFHGGMGGHIHSLGVTLAEEGGPKSEDAALRSATLVEAGGLVLSSVMKTSVYSSDPVSRACAQLLALSGAQAVGGGGEGRKGEDSSVVTPPESQVVPGTAKEVVVALETIVKYVDNILASPLDPKFSRIRVANGFFDRKIGGLPGGGGVMRAVGFKLADDGGRMHYIFRRDRMRGLRRARQTLADMVAAVKA